MDEQIVDDGTDISISDEIDSDLDSIAATQKGKGSGYIEQENM